MANKRERHHSERGITLIELIVAFTIVAVLSLMAVPVAHYRVRHYQERELQLALREIRRAINTYKDMADLGQLGPQKLGSEGYPETLEMLVNGVNKNGTIVKVRFLRRIPKDPMTNSWDWGVHSNQDDPSSHSWGGQNVFDVYTKSTMKAADGTPYADW